MKLSSLLLAVVLAAGALPAQNRVVPDLPGFTRGQIKTDEGTAGYVHRPGPGPAVLLIPGSFSDTHQWRQVIAGLPKDWHLVLAEVRGHGRSWPPPAHGSIEQFASDMLRIADQLHLGRFYAGGHSIGGMIALEMGRAHPERIAGIVSIEGWTYAQAVPDAFGGDNYNTLTPAQQTERKAIEAQGTSAWTEADRKTFARIWRQWDGRAFLASTGLPILEIYGDRGRPRPEIAKLGIPQRANIEMAWLENSSHGLPVERPAELARLMSGFITAQRAALLADPAVDWSKPAAFPLAKSKTSMVYRGEKGRSSFNLHSYLFHHDGRFWAMWSSAAVTEEDPDQQIFYATSRDGHTWSAPQILAADPDGPTGPARWIARGMFVYEGRLTALGAYIEGAAYGKRGKAPVWPKLRLVYFQWEKGAWKNKGTFADNCMNNFAPADLGGRLAMICRDENMDVSMALPGAAPRTWVHTPLAAAPPFHLMDEPTWYAAPNGQVHMIVRDNTKSRRLIRALSSDGGRTWTHPVLTNYPDATSKNWTGRLSNGWYYLVNNPDPARRNPLSVSFSRDGWVFSHPMNIRNEAPERRDRTSFRTTGTLQYPHALEHGGSLWVIYSTNKEDIEITEIRLSDLNLR